MDKPDLTEVSSSTPGMLQGALCRTCLDRPAMWRSKDGPWICWACHPPASLELVHEVRDQEAA